MNSLDEAIDNLDKILAHILIEQDLRLKGIQIGHGWKQLTVIKEAITKLSFLDRRQYKKKLVELENRLLTYEDNYISEVELKLALEDVQKVNELLNNYKTQLIIDKRKEIEEKLIILRNELQRIYEKNKNKNDKKWIEMNSQISGIMGLIQNVLNSKDNAQFTDQREQMNQVLKTIYVQKRIKDEEEEELLKIAEEMEQLKNLQRELDQQLQKDNENISEIDKQQGTLQNNQQHNAQQYNQAFNYVQMRRRTKVKLFFQGLFTAVGCLGGKIGAAFGFALGTITGKKASEAVTKSSIN
ncbi:unnamed protein product (macronuclear) [Paramecium tetraurelia]|uniref:t-SNARE coiled-coil homology domain-containing protein n=1 Tax=Paramecium tetraurelia TaxID=5888 RepID=A0C653_PARTE|nr:uncharacterized protein GSPATT00035399001 [Paramecium tetraurelia]CAK66270.1 unnamed protein product [Paramecium tetraurelia]|eukprot:XP_001433667.1 hypothetical protein (macronuclear) [Paramecium tetraurelia strain d4-2]